MVRLAMRGAYLAMDRYDIQHTTKELATEMKISRLTPHAADPNMNGIASGAGWVQESGWVASWPARDFPVGRLAKPNVEGKHFLIDFLLLASLAGEASLASLASLRTLGVGAESGTWRHL